MAYATIEKLSTNPSSTQTIGTWVDTTEALASYHKDLKEGNFSKPNGKLTLEDLTLIQINVTGKVIINGKLIFNSDTSKDVSEATISRADWQKHLDDYDNPHNVRLKDLYLVGTNNQTLIKNGGLTNKHQGLNQYAIAYGKCYTDLERPVSSLEEKAIKAIEDNDYDFIIESDTENPALGKIDSTNGNHFALSKTVYDYFASRISDVINAIYPKGSIYTNMDDDRNPRDYFGVGTWVHIGEGKTLMTTGGDYLPGTTGGNSTVTLNDVAYLPAHTHTGSTDTQGNHQHNRGSWNFSGGYTFQDLGRSGDGQTDSGVFWTTGSGYRGKDHHQANAIAIRMNAAWQNDWGQCSNNGSHSHSGTTTKNRTTTNIEPFSIMQPYITANVWRRTA